MDTRSRGKQRAIRVTTAVGLASIATTVVASVLLWNDTAGASTQSASSGTSSSVGSESSSGDHDSHSSEQDEQNEQNTPNVSTSTGQQQLVTPSRGGAAQGRSSGS
jgi:hypothetical protein